MGSGPTARSRWPVDAPHSAAGFERVESPATCVLTRFQVRSVWDLLRFYRAFRRIRRDAEKIQGLLYSGFFIENLRTCYSFSLWADEAAILEFGTVVQSHVHAARHAFGATFRKDLGRPEIWSTQWKLAAASNNLNWEGVDLRPLISSLAVGHELQEVEIR
ncbi:MAG TPA: hypothetical protein VE685_02460 [Thermoanaerobaculia bacterium]|nr:hypothetical protein [Thermoanaerobaculia bacterium]